MEEAMLLRRGSLDHELGRVRDWIHKSASLSVIHGPRRFLLLLRLSFSLTLSYIELFFCKFNSSQLPRRGREEFVCLLPGGKTFLKVHGKLVAKMAQTLDDHLILSYEPRGIPDDDQGFLRNGIIQHLANRCYYQLLGWGAHLFFLQLLVFQELSFPVVLQKWAVPGVLVIFQRQG